MKLAQLMPIRDRSINGYSLIEDVFGENFAVCDDMDERFTTAKNVRLLAQARVLLESVHLFDAPGLAHALSQLREQADRLLQADYDRTVWRERQYLGSAPDHPILPKGIE